MDRDIGVKEEKTVLNKFTRVNIEGELSNRPFFIDTSKVITVRHHDYVGSRRMYLTCLTLLDSESEVVVGEVEEIVKYIREDEVFVACPEHPMKAMQDRIDELERQQTAMGSLINVVNHLRQNSGGHFAAIGKCTVCGVEDTPMLNMVCEHCIKGAFDEWQRAQKKDKTPVCEAGV